MDFGKYFVHNEVLEDIPEQDFVQMGITEEDITLSQLVNNIDAAQLELNSSAGDGSFSSQVSDDIKIVDTKTEDSISKRFGISTDKDVENLLSESVNANTKHNTKWAVSVFDAWRQERGNLPGILSMDAVSLDKNFSRFVMEARKKNGEEYPHKSIYLIICGLLRFLRDNKVYDMNFLDQKDYRFAEFRKILDSRMKNVLKRGVGGSTKQAEPVFPNDEAQIWEKGVFGDETSESLQSTMFFYNCKLFGLRGHDEHHDLMADQFTVGENREGKYIEIVGRASKTYKGGLAQMDIDRKQIRHYSHSEEGERCIVSLYEKYLEAIENDGKFYRRPLSCGPPRYGTQAVGINKLKNMMKIICQRAELKGNYTNHSGKRTCATQLYMAGVDEQDIMRTGHRSEHRNRTFNDYNSLNAIAISIFTIYKHKGCNKIAKFSLGFSLSSGSQFRLQKSTNLKFLM